MYRQRTDILYASGTMRATGVAFLCTNGNQMRSGEMSKGAFVQVFSSDRKDKPGYPRTVSDQEKRESDAAIRAWFRRRAGRDD